MFIDSHTHYDLNKFNQRRWELLEECKKRGIEKIVNPAILYESNDNMRMKLDFEKFPELMEELLRANVAVKDIPRIYFAAGVHPGRVWKGNAQLDGSWERHIRKCASEEKTVAIGETGLDYHHEVDVSAMERQKFWFRKQLEIAEEFKLPLILHIRMADEDAIEILKEYDLKQSGVVHCFNRGWEIAEKYLNMGLYLGIGGMMTLKECRELRDALVKIPLERIVMETDAPYVKPEWCEDTINTSLNIPRMVKELAELKGSSDWEVEAVTTKNAENLFGI